MSRLGAYAKRIFRWLGVKEASTQIPKKEKETPVAPKEEHQETKSMEPQFETKTSPTLEGVIHMGHSVFIKGELSGDENLTIDGRVEGKIQLKDHHLVVGLHGNINGEIHAKDVTIRGNVVGNIYASGLVEIKSSGSVVGDIKASRISFADGARFMGSVNMDSGGDTTERSNPPKAESANVSHKQSSGEIGLASIPK